jgi:hypothetical protein
VQQEGLFYFFCRLSIWLYTWSSYSVLFPRRIIGNVWFLDATGFWWLHKIFSTRLPGGILIGYTMFIFLRSLLLFWWLLFVSTLSDPNLYTLILWNSLIKGYVHRLMQRPGFSPISEKKLCLNIPALDSRDLCLHSDFLILFVCCLFW